MLLLVVRGASGVCTWYKKYSEVAAYQWVCSRDSFTVSQPNEVTQAEATALAIATHSAQLVGAIAQVVELDL